MSTTANYGWTKPTVGGDADTWGTELDTDLDSIDTIVKGIDDRVTTLEGASFSGPVLLAHGNVATGGAIFLTKDLSGYTAYKRLEIKLNHVNPGPLATGVAMQFSTDGGTTWITTGYGWSLATLGAAYAFASNISSSDATQVRIINVNAIVDGSIEFCVLTGGLISKSFIGGNQLSSNNAFYLGAGGNATTGLNGIKIYGLGTAVASAGTYDIIGYP